MGGGEGSVFGVFIICHQGGRTSADSAPEHGGRVTDSRPSDRGVIELDSKPI